MDQEIQVDKWERMSVLDSMGKFQYKEFKQQVSVYGRVVLGQNTNFLADLSQSILFTPLLILEKTHFAKRETAPFAFLSIDRILSPSLLILSQSFSDFYQFNTNKMTHFYAVSPLPKTPALEIQLECPATVALGAPLWGNRFESDCLKVKNGREFLFTLGVLFPYVGKPIITGFTIELYSETDLIAYYSLGYRENFDSSFLISSRPGEKQTYSRSFFDDPYSDLYIVYHNNTIILGKGDVVGDIVKFKSKLYANITRIEVKAGSTVMVKRMSVREVGREAVQAVNFARTLPTLADKAIFTEELTDGAICELTGEPRVASVIYTCGSEDNTYLKSVNEYATCKYTAVVATPALCPASAIDNDDIENIDCVVSKP